MINESLALLRISFPSVAFGAALPIHSSGGSSAAQRTENDRRRDKCEQLVDQAAAVLARRGVVDTSLRSLAAELGTSARTLVYWFGSKDDLLHVGLDLISDPATLEMLLAALGRPNFTGQDHQTYCAHSDFGYAELRGHGRSG
jgi:AcrR family transcriptional regulator